MGLHFYRRQHWCGEGGSSDFHQQLYISFNQTNEGTQAMFKKEANARMKFFDKISKGESKEKLADKYFEE